MASPSLRMTKCSERGMVTLCDLFEIFSPLKISLEQLTLVISNFVHWLTT